MNNDELLRQGISALKSGRKVEARKLFLEAIQQDGRDEMAWLWLSGAVDPVEDRRICLENVLSINPHNHAARKGLESLSDAAGKQAASSPKIAPMRSETSPSQLAVGSATMEDQDDRTISEHDDGATGAGSREVGKQAWAGWKWLALGVVGVVLLLLRGYWLSRALGWTLSPDSSSSPATLVASPALSSGQAYAAAMGPALEKLVVWAHGPLADWNGLMAEAVPGASGGTSRGLELSACLQMAKACAADAAMWDRMRETFLPAVSELGAEGDGVLSALDSAAPPSSVVQTHEQVVACVVYETELAKSVHAFFDGSGALDVALASDLCDHLSSEISTLSQFVQDNQ